MGLYKRKVVVDKLCDQCLVEFEDEVQALWSCDGIREVWEAPFAAANMKNPRMNSMCDLVSFILQETGELDKFAMVAWAIWQCRNKLRLKEDNTPIHKVYKSALSLLTEFWQKKPSHTGQRFSRPTHWTPPPPNSVKVNFDGTVFGDSNEAGVGVVVRNDRGVVRAALLEKILMPSSVEVLRCWLLGELLFLPTSRVLRVYVLKATPRRW